MPHRFLIVTNMKNEGPYILEWMAHHLALGFGHVIAVTNDCVDGTDEILQRLQALGHVTHLINPAV
ncbi:MAG: glycosyltransferase family 2 protein, partial [Pseudomonadota bacterium]